MRAALEQLPGVRPAAVGLAQPGQHPRQFGDPVVVVEAAHPAGACRGPPLSTTRWTSAYAATCGRCVTTMTWWVRASRASRRPICTAARPPTPASTSSNTIVVPSADAASTTSSASITRDSSPPDALLLSGSTSVAAVCGEAELDGVDTVVPGVHGRTRRQGQRCASRRARRQPATATVNSASAMARPASSAVTALARPLAALVRALVSSVAALTTFGLELVDAALQFGERLLGDVELRQPLARLVRPLQHTVDVGGVLAGQRAQLGLPGQLGLQSAGVAGQFGQVVAEFGRRRR